MNLGNEIAHASQWNGPRLSGRVTHMIGLLITSHGPDASLGELCTIYGKKGGKVTAQVVGFKEEKVLLMPLDEGVDISPGAEVFPSDSPLKIGVGEGLIGRVIDARGQAIDGKGEWFADHYISVSSKAPSPLERELIRTPLETGIKTIDALCTIGQGQRMGIFSGSGVGKSTLLGSIAKKGKADVNVIALIGERGREVREFIEHQLGSSGLRRSIVIVATSDQPALLRSLGAEVATAIAEYFRDLGKNVLLFMDSISRFAHARREIGLASFEPPTTRGYPPSVFSYLPRLLERAGNGKRGSITGFYTILAEADDMSDPIADQMRSLLDGHLILSRKLAQSGQFPPIDPLQSLSRVMHALVDKEQIDNANRLKHLLYTYHEAEDLLNIGAYVSGSNPYIDEALAKIDPIRTFLLQDKDLFVSSKDSVNALKTLFDP
ncbi:MAG: FliI/YscN family ATPase [Chlamydiia bacterium]|nr:FliI/YscN family ATPase [Chlamydiia bacterium]